MVQLIKVPLADAHIVNGNEFPVAYQFDKSSYSPKEIVEFLATKAKQEDFFNKQLATHGAVVLRNTNTTDPEIFSQFVEAIGKHSNHEPFEQNGSLAKRTILTNIITTANEGPSDLTIHQHNEFSRFSKYPTTLFFICNKYDKTTKGGATPLVHGGEFFNELFARVPELLNNLSKHGLYMAQVWQNISNNRTAWRDYFCFGREIQNDDDLATAKQKAEEIVARTVSDDYEWDKDDNLIVHQHTKPIREFKNPYTGQEYPVFFNSLATFYYDYKTKKKQQSTATATAATKKVTYDNNEPINEAWLEAVLEESIKLSYAHQWQEGDIAIVDNYQVSHGRLPWSNGARSVIVSMWDRVEKGEFEVWKAD